MFYFFQTTFSGLKVTPVFLLSNSGSLFFCALLFLDGENVCMNNRAILSRLTDKTLSSANFELFVGFSKIASSLLIIEERLSFVFKVVGRCFSVVVLSGCSCNDEPRDDTEAPRF